MNSSARSFFDNAFWVLKAEYQTTQADLSELVEDAEFDDIHPQELIQRSQQALLSPTARLEQELSWLPGLSNEQIDQTRRTLGTSPDVGIMDAIRFYPELPQANVIAHALANGVTNSAMLKELLRCWNDVDGNELLGFINDQRQIAKFPVVTLTQLETSITTLRTAHARCAANAIWRLDEPGKLMEALVETEIANGRLGNPLLAQLIREYDTLSEPRLATINEAIDHQLELSRQSTPDLNAITTEISFLLQRWDDINQPVQVFEQHQGHEESRSKLVYEKIRLLCIELANQRGEFSYAKRLSEALLHTFPELESVAEVLKGDVALLGELDGQQEAQTLVEPLEKECYEAKFKLSTLKSELRRTGFTSAAFGSCGRIFAEFQKATTNPAAKDLPFKVILELAIYLNNEQNDPESAFRLIDGLLSFTTPPTAKLIKKLEEQRAVLHINWKMNELKAARGNKIEMIRLIDEMLVFAQGQDRRDLLALKSKVEKQKSENKFGWWIAIVFGIIMLIVLSAN